MYNPNALHALEHSLAQLEKTTDISPELRFRINYFYQDLHSTFHSLYGDNPNADRALHALLKVLVKKYQARPDALKIQDRTRENNPHWFHSNKLVGMMLYVDRFAGDLKGLRSKLDYFEELSINLLHLLPVMEAPEKKNDGGYAVSNYVKVDSKFGTTRELKALCKDLRSKDMHLMLDLVLNHTSDEHVWAEKARKGSKRYMEYFHTFEDRTVPDLYENSLPEIFPENSPGNFTWDEEMQRWVMTVFNDYQWDLNYANPQVFNEMIAVLLEQANWGVDIFRLDAVVFLWKQMGTNSQNLPQAHIILQLFKICTQLVAPGVIFLAEAIVGPDDIMGYFGETETWSNECDAAYNATMMAALWDSMATRNNRILTQAIHGVPRKPDGTTWINYIRCHDDIGLGYANQYIVNSGYTPEPHRSFMVKFLTGEFEGSFSRGFPFMPNPLTGEARISGSLASLAGLESGIEEGNDEMIQLALDRIVLLQAIALAWEGIPMLYYGDEIATLNDYSYTQNPDLEDDNRWLHRPVIDWDRAEKRHDPESNEGYVFLRIKRLVALRQSLEVFTDNQSVQALDTGNEHIFAFSRRHNDEKFLMLANLTDTPQDVGLAFLHYLRMERHVMTDLFHDELPEYQEGRMVIPPYGFHWFYQEG